MNKYLKKGFILLYSTCGVHILRRKRGGSTELVYIDILTDEVLSKPK